MTRIISTELDVLGQTEILCHIAAEVEYQSYDRDAGISAGFVAEVTRVCTHGGALIPLEKVSKKDIEMLEDRFCEEASAEMSEAHGRRDAAKENSNG